MLREALGFPPRSTVPGPRSIIKSADGMLRRPLEFLTAISKQYGDIVRFPLLRREVFLFNHPDAIEELVIARKELLIKDWLTREIGVVVGKGLLLSEGALWKKQRRLIQPGFHRERIAAYAEVMVRYTERALEGWRDGETRDVHVDLMRLTLDIVAKTLFGVEVGRSHDASSTASRRSRRASPASTRSCRSTLPTPGNLSTKRAVAELDTIIYGIIRERRARSDEGDEGDLISMLIDASEGEGRVAHTTRAPEGRSGRVAHTTRAPEGRSGRVAHTTRAPEGRSDSVMDDVQLRDEVVTLLLAGHETTALSLG